MWGSWRILTCSIEGCISSSERRVDRPIVDDKANVGLKSKTEASVIASMVSSSPFNAASCSSCQARAFNEHEQVLLRRRSYSYIPTKVTAM